MYQDLVPGRYIPCGNIFDMLCGNGKANCCGSSECPARSIYERLDHLIDSLGYLISMLDTMIHQEEEDLDHAAS